LRQQVFLRSGDAQRNRPKELPVSGRGSEVVLTTNETDYRYRDTGHFTSERSRSFYI